MPYQTCQESDTDPFVSQGGDEGAPAAVTAATMNARSSIEIVKVLSHGVGRESFAWLGLCGEETLILAIPRFAIDILC